MVSALRIRISTPPACAPRHVGMAQGARTREASSQNKQTNKQTRPNLRRVRSEGKDESKIYLELVSLQNVEDLVGGTAENIVGLAPQVVCDEVEKKLVRPLRLPRLRPVPQTEVGVLARGRLGRMVISERNSRVSCDVTAVAGGTCVDGMWRCMLAERPRRDEIV